MGEVDEEKEKMIDSENLQETDKKDPTEDKEHSTEDIEEKKGEVGETTLEKEIIERGRKRSECLQCSCSRSRSVSWGRVEQARVSKIERARAAGELDTVSKLEKPRAAGELIRAS